MGHLGTVSVYFSRMSLSQPSKTLDNFLHLISLDLFLLIDSNEESKKSAPVITLLFISSLGSTYKFCSLDGQEILKFVNSSWNCLR